MQLFNTTNALVSSALALASLAMPAMSSNTSGTISPTTTGTINGAPFIGTGTTGIANEWRPKRRFPSPGSPGLWEIRLPNTPSGHAERFLLQVPSNPVSTDEVPLLVAFHRYGNSMYDIAVNTELMTEADERGWYVVAPMGIADDNLNSVQAQMNYEYVLDLMMRFYPIDPTRIYGIGHSMGGGNCLSYAARHLDPSKPMFAALVNHTGVMSQSHSYENDAFSTNGFLQPIWEFWYGGDPSTAQFNYQRSSLIDVPFEMGFPRIPAVDQNTDMARNLCHIPTQTWIADGDPLQELVVQNIAFHDQMVLRGGDHELITINFNDHLWSILDYEQVFDFLASKTLNFPTAAETLADRDGKYFHFEITQEVQGAFTPFTWEIDGLLNTLRVSDAANLDIMDVDVSSADLSARPGSTLIVDLAIADASTPEIRLNGISSPPHAVTCDGQPVISWSFDPVDQCVVFEDTLPGTDAHVWAFTF